MTKGYSLKKWHNDGCLERELSLYRELNRLGCKITLISYGDCSELEYSKAYPFIKVVFNRYRLSDEKYSKWIHILHWRHLVSATLLKTNQTNGGAEAIRSSLFWRIPLIWRSGYLWSDFVRNWKGVMSEPHIKALELEMLLLRKSNIVITTTLEIRSKLIQFDKNSALKHHIIPNYVDVDHFSPMKYLSTTNQVDVLFVGRLQEQKNLISLLVAVRELGLSAVIIGQGKLSATLRSEFNDISDRLQWIDCVPNLQLVNYYRNAKVFVLPSFFEGHPKVLIEAMSCEMAVLGTKIIGIQDLIIEGETGWLCDVSSQSIELTLRNILADPDERSRRGKNARKYIKENFSLSNIVSKEYNLYKELISSK